jgi:hypothetical protein
MAVKIIRKSRSGKRSARRVGMSLPKKVRKVSRKSARKSTRKSARKSSRKSTHKVASVGSKSQVYKGHALHTAGGLKKKDIKRIKVGTRNGKSVYRYVSAKKHAAGKKLQGRGQGRVARMWRMALKQVTGGRIPRKGTSEYKMAKAAFRKMLASRARRVGRVGRARRVRR